MSVISNPQVTLRFRFRYDGIMRLVEGELDGNQQQIIGRELRKSGKFSNKIKRFSLVKIESMELAQ